MTTSTSSPKTPQHSSQQKSSPQEPGFFDWFRSVLGRPPGTTAVESPRSQQPSEQSDSDCIVAPGGFRIQRHQPVDAKGTMNITSFNDLLPEVREGLNLLPPLPTIILELLREIQSTSSTASSVAEIASSDPSL